MNVNMNMAFQYCAGSIICMVFLIFIARNISKHTLPSSQNKLFILIIAVSAIGAIADAAYALREFDVIEAADWVWYITEIIYSLTGAFGGYLWFIYSEREQKAKWTKSKGMNIIASIPMLLIACLLISTGFTGLVFTINDGQYERGKLFYVCTVTVLVLVELSGIRAFIKSTKREYYLKKADMRLLTSYALFLLVTQMLLLIFGSIMPFRTFGTTAVFFLVHDKVMKENISTDIQTGIGNRASMEKYLKRRFNQADEKSYMVMIDIDNFKEINDTYGHNVGDQAIRIMGQAMMRSMIGDGFIGRYGGDEFIILIHVNEKSELLDVLERLSANVITLSEEEKLPFKLEYSIGYANKTSDIKTIPDMIEAADAEMYKEKRRKHVDR